MSGRTARLTVTAICGLVLASGGAPAAIAADAPRPSAGPGTGTPAHRARAADRTTTVPRTRARSARVSRDAVTPGGRIDFLGVHWRGDAQGDAAVRFRGASGRWGRWQRIEGDLRGRGRTASDLVPARRATGYQVRAPRGARDVRAVAINASDGPREAIVARGAGTARRGAATLGLPGACYRPRAAWGADESLRFDSTGKEVWPPQYFPVQRLTVHHTVTVPGQEPGNDAAAVMRAIYRYHAVELGWGDIGYQLLVDPQGCVYEGRWSGPDPLPVYQAPTSLPPQLLAVNGGHVLGFNGGNVGIALLGDFNREQPSAAAQRSLTLTLAALARLHGLDPLGGGTYVNPTTGARKDTANISGHRDWLATECPGEHLYARLPAIRQDVARLVGR